VTKVQNVYVPVSLVSVAIVLMLLQATFLPTHSGDDQLQQIMITSVKILIFALVLWLGMGLCALFGYPFTPTHWSLLQLLAVALTPGALRGIVGYVAGDSVAVIVSLVLFLGLIGYFFNEEPMNALVAIFLVFAAHLVVASLLMPLFTMLLA
jgi:hypothetical protein